MTNPMGASWYLSSQHDPPPTIFRPSPLEPKLGTGLPAATVADGCCGYQDIPSVDARIEATPTPAGLTRAVYSIHHYWAIYGTNPRRRVASHEGITAPEHRGKVPSLFAETVVFSCSNPIQ
ncbi:hypothetical protein GN244_ATG11985 [Phytophthora infestans]|uniref:Uncharacterized protein n=1 Tax=Phytophthora infestans TaxID=4787 RepID=A0A833WB03_PHYIN|nr:hypothetical protein GN244_ATG11985 [Phytophthora infestans]KAF4144624.1 hypothetical protein GN958_ATG06154 [Phytophthora infestans]